MNFRRHELTIDEKIQRKYFRLAVFKGKGGSSTTTTTRNIPAQSANEATLENGLMNYNTTGLNSASSVLSNGVSSIDSTYNPDYSTLASNYNNSMSSALSGYNSGMSDVLNGKLSDEYTTNRENALNSELQSTVGSTISGLANRGILNSSVTDNALNNISQNASNTLASEYSSDLAQQASLLNQSYSNNSSNASNVLSGNESAQSSSYTQPTSLLSYASQLASGSQNMYNEMYSGRMGTSGTTSTQSTDSGNSGTWSALGSLGAAAITACFAAGTSILTPNGKKPIEYIVIGDKVISNDGKIETVTYVNPGTICAIVELMTDKGIVRTTDTQRLYTDLNKEPEYVLDIKDDIISEHGPAKIISRKLLPPELVYDFTTTGSNSFYANGLLAEGWD